MDYPQNRAIYHLSEDLGQISCTRASCEAIDKRFAGRPARDTSIISPLLKLKPVEKVQNDKFTLAFWECMS